MDLTAKPMKAPASGDSGSQGGREFDLEMGTEYIGPLRPGDLSTAVEQAALTFIQQTLAYFAQVSSFGTVIRYAANHTVRPQPVILFGFRDPPSRGTIAEKWLLFSNSPNIPVVVECEVLNTSVSAPTRWRQEVIHHSCLMIQNTSVGAISDLTDARSFGGYLRTPRRVLGLSAGHSLVHRPGTEVCSPSTVEVTARLETILPYTSYSVGGRKQRPRLQQEANHLIFDYRTSFSNAGDGVPVRGLNAKVSLLGPRLGFLVYSQTCYADLLDRHNQGLKIQGSEGFRIPRDITNALSRLDWAVFTIIEERRGNNYSEAERAPVGPPSLLGPGDIVMKSGRTTGHTKGIVNKAVVQQWVDGVVSVEIGVVGDTGPFADSGDSGSLCIMEDKEQELRAAGLVIGTNSRYRLAIITPLWAVLENIEMKVGEPVSFAE